MKRRRGASLPKNDPAIIRRAVGAALRQVATDDDAGFLASLEALSEISWKMWRHLNRTAPDAARAVAPVAFADPDLFGPDTPREETQQ